MGDLSQIHLRRAEYRTLRMLSRGRDVGLTEAAPLERLGLVDIVPQDFSSSPPADPKPLLSLEGERYLQLRREQACERRWTRALAIAALVISLVSLALEMQSRGWLPPFSPAPAAVTQALPD